MGREHAHKDRIVLAALCLLAVVLHLPVLGLSFFSDDLSILYRIGVTGDAGTGSFFRPLPDWTFWVDHAVVGPRPWFFRLENVLLLGINGWLVFLLAQRMLAKAGLEKGRVPLLAGLFFLLYPFHNEPQLWIVGRSTAMSTGFVLLGLIIALGPVGATQRAWGMGLVGLLGAMCYESALLLPIMLVACLPLVPPNERRTWVPLIVVGGAVVALNLLARALFTGHVANAYGSAFFTPSLPHFAVRGTKAVARLFLPPLDDAHGQMLRAAAVGAGLLIAGLLLHRRARGHRKLMAVLVQLLIVSSAIATIAGVSTRTSEGDRFLYLPSAFLSLAAAVTLGALLRGPWQVAVAALLGGCSVAAMHQNHTNWKVASHTIEAIVQATPQASAGSRVFIHGLPGDHQGAFILRHGFHEALLYAGKDTTNLVRADTLLWSMAGNGALPALSFEDRDDTLIIRPQDRIVTWNGRAFVPVPH